VPCTNGKVRYKSRREADDRCYQVLRAGGPKLQIYRCLDGNHFHVTSIPLIHFANSHAHRQIVLAQQQLEIDDDLRARAAELAYEILRPQRERTAARLACAKAVAALRRSMAADKAWQKRAAELLGLKKFVK